MIKSFRDEWLELWYVQGIEQRLVPAQLRSSLFRKLQVLEHAQTDRDLWQARGCRFEYLSGKLKDWCSIRVNRQYRLIFQWREGFAHGIYLDPHTYR